MQYPIVFAEKKDIPAWMELVHLVEDGFPGLVEEDYLQVLRQCIEEKRALMIKDKGMAIGILLFSYQTSSIDFLGVHPRYRQQGMARAFLEIVMTEFLSKEEISVSTFREGDERDNGSREVCKRLGFAESKLLIEFGYPTQQFIFKKESSQGEIDHE